MNAKMVWTTLGLVVAAVTVTTLVVSQEKPPMSPEEQAMMQKWMEFATPGESHKRLAERVGAWDFTVKTWQAPGAKADESAGSSKARMVMDGRYLMDESEGSFQGMPFTGMGVTGYDNLNKQYVSAWIDNMGTGIMVSRGTCTGEVCTFEATSPDPMTGTNKSFKSIERRVNKDEWVMEMYDRTPEGKEWKMMEATYRRRS